MRSVYTEMTTIQGAVTAVIERYREVWPRIAGNYTLIGFLVWRDFYGVQIPPQELDRAADGEVANLASLHRGISIARKPYLTDEDRQHAADCEEESRQLLSPDRVDQVETWDRPPSDVVVLERAERRVDDD